MFEAFSFAFMVTYILGVTFVFVPENTREYVCLGMGMLLGAVLSYPCVLYIERRAARNRRGCGPDNPDSPDS
jgi:hypothetical protein